MDERAGSEQFQRTLREGIRFEGVGIHSGATATCAVEPADANTGYIARLPNGEHAPINLDAVVATDHATTLNLGGQSYMTVEHLLSALYGCGVDNAEIVLEGPEVPILDGSAQPYAEAISDNTVEQEAERKFLEIAEVFEYQEGASSIVFEPNEIYEIAASVDFPHPDIGFQEGEFTILPHVYAREIAPARTFGFIREVEALQAKGLIKGASPENAAVFSADGIHNPPLRFSDEPLRHKVLDCVGDLALIGVRLRCRVRTVRGGHGLHYRGAKALLASGSLILPTLD